jgi:hypothetical protein
MSVSTDPRRFRPMSLADPLAVLLARMNGDSPTNPGSYPIKEGNTIDLPANAGFTQVVSFRLPQNMVGMLTAFAYGCNTVDDFSFVRWQLRINGQAQVGYDNMVGPMATFVFPEQVQLNLPTDTTVEIFARELGGLVRRQIAAGLWGRYWPLNNSRQGLDIAAGSPR